MERNVNYILVGTFISLVGIGFALFVIWLVGSYDTRVYDRYTIYFEGAVTGLQEGNQVQYLGVEVGRVIGIRLDSVRSDLIKVDIEVDQNTPVRKSTEATLKPQGITGQSFIALTTDDEASKPPRRMEDEQYPVIIGSGSRLDELFDSLPEVSRKLIRIAERVDRILSDKNIQKIDSILSNVESVSGSLQRKTDVTLANLNGALKDVRKTAKNANGLIGNTNKTIDVLRDDLIAARKAIDNVISFTGRVDHLTARNEQALDSFLGNGLGRISLLARDARKAANDIESVGEKLSERPSSLVFQPKYKGLKIPKK